MFDRDKGKFYGNNVFVSDNNICYHKDIYDNWHEVGKLLEEKGVNKSISSGTYHAAIIKADNSVWTIGDNNAGQLGDGTTTDRCIFINTGIDAISINCEECRTTIVKIDESIWFVGEDAGDDKNIWTQVKKSLNNIKQNNLTEAVNEYNRLVTIHKELFNTLIIISYKLENSILDSVDKEALIDYENKIKLQLKDSQETLNAINELILT